MQGMILVLIPAIIISVGISFVKFKYPSFSVFVHSFQGRLPIKVVVILILAISSTFIMDYVQCNVVKAECKPDALAAVGYFFYATLVFIVSIVLEYILTTCLRKYCRSSG